MQQSRPRRQRRPRQRRSTAAPGGPARAAATPIRSARPGRRQPHDILVPRMPEMTAPRHAAHRPQGRRPHRARQHARRASTPRSRTACDMIEFDVLPERAGRQPGALLLAHDFEDAARAHAAHARGGPRPPRRARRSTASSSTSTSSAAGYEERVIAALRERGLDERALISTMEDASLPRRCARLEPRIRARLVGARGQARLPGQPGRPRCWRWPTVQVLRRAAARRSPPARIRARRDRRGHVRTGALVTPHLVRARCAAPAASSTSGRSTTPSASARFERDGRHRRHHQRPAAVRRQALRRDRALAALSSPAGRRRRSSGGPCASRLRALRTTPWPFARHSKYTTCRAAVGPARPAAA